MVAVGWALELCLCASHQSNEIKPVIPEQHILDTEENWNGWKNDGCPSFVKERYVRMTSWRLSLRCE